MIMNAPEGSTIRLATMAFKEKDMVPLLRDAHDNRNVHIRMVSISKDEPDGPVSQMFDLLNDDDDPWSGYKLCSDSCFVNNQPFGGFHQKLFLFSATGAAQNVTVTSSQNLSPYLALRSNNQAFINVGNAKIYNAASRYIDSIFAAKPINPYKDKSIRSGNTRYFFGPNQNLIRSKDIYNKALNGVRCQAARGSFGNGKGRTVLEFHFAGWEGNRTDIAKRLVSLKNKGCHVRVIISLRGSGPKAVLTLLNGGIKVRSTDKYLSDGTRITWSHSKYFVIDGSWRGNNKTRVVYTGTANMGISAMKSADNTIVQIQSRKFGKDFRNNFQAVWKTSTPIKKSDVPTR